MDQNQNQSQFDYVKQNNTNDIVNSVVQPLPISNGQLTTVKINQNNQTTETKQENNVENNTIINRMDKALFYSHIILVIVTLASTFMTTSIYGILKSIYPVYVFVYNFISKANYAVLPLTLTLSVLAYIYYPENKKATAKGYIIFNILLIVVLCTIATVQTISTMSKYGN